MELPPIIVTPVDPECRLTREECEELERRIKSADTGDVVACPVPINIYHYVDGLWILSEDLAEFHTSPDPDQPKKEPAESTYVPTGD